MDGAWDQINSQMKFINWLIDQINYSYMYWECCPEHRDMWTEKPYFDRNQALNLGTMINESFYGKGDISNPRKPQP